MSDGEKQTLQALLSKVLDAAADAIIVIDEDQVILVFSPAAERMFDYGANEVLGRSLDLLLPIGAAAAHRRNVRQFAAAESAGRPMSSRVAARGRRKDGSEFPTETSIAKFTHAGEILFVAIARDITQRRHAEEALAESEERYRSLFENSIDGILLTAPNGDILAANPEACRLLGRTEKEICRVGRAGIVDPTDFRLPALLDVRERLGKHRGELILVRGDGARFPAEMASGLFKDRDGNLRTSIVFRDVTERVRTYQLLEQRVAQRTRELAALLDVGREVASTLTLEPLLDTILTRLETVIDYTGAGVAILRDGELEVADYRGPVPCHKIVGARIAPERDTGYQRVALTRAPVMIADLGNEIPWLQAAWEGWDKEWIESIHSWLGVPLIAKGELAGMLWLDHVDPGHFTEHHAQQALAFANQAAVAIENARLYQQAQRTATIEERQRLSRELHDSISQALYGIVLGARTATRLLADDPPAAAEPLQYVLTLAETALAEMRAMIFELRPDSLKTDGLVSALSRQMDLISARHGLVMSAELGEEPALPLPVKEALYRIAQQALHNTASHAQARRVSVRLVAEPESVTLEISDDGRGFDPTASHAGHMGLQSMRERAERVQGACLIESSPGQGATVRVHIPTKG